MDFDILSLAGFSITDICFINVFVVHTLHKSCSSWSTTLSWQLLPVEQEKNVALYLALFVSLLLAPFCVASGGTVPLWVI
jgi:hypothetical protein